MSDSYSENSSNGFAKEAIRLLKEYTKTLRDSVQQAYTIANEFAGLRSGGSKQDDLRRKYLQVSHQSIQQSFSRIIPPATELARVVSQRIEHSKLDTLERIELRLRLGEFEGVLVGAQSAISNINL